MAPVGADFANVQTVNDFVPITFGPKATITSSLSRLGSTQTALITVELSATSSDFSSADLNVTNGSLSGFQVVAGSNGKQYTATFTPAPNTKADAVIVVAAGSFSEAADITKTNLSAASLSLPVDTTPPSLVSLALANNAQVLNLLMSQPLANGQAGAPALPPSSAFALQADGQAVVINAIATNGTTLSLTLATPIAENVKQLTLTYTDSSSGDDAAALQDLAGQDAAGFTGILTNQAPQLSYSPGTSPSPKFIEAKAAASVVPGSLSLSDSDSQAFSQAKVTISAGFTKANLPDKGDQLDVTITGPSLTKNYDPATGTLTLIGNANAEDYKKVLQTLTFSHQGQAPTSISKERTLSITVRDTGGSGLAPQFSSPITLKVDVDGINSAQPLLDPAVITAAMRTKLAAPAPAANTIPAGAMRVSELVRTGAAGNVSDGDGDAAGVAIVGTSADVLAWYSTNNGAAWQRVDAATTAGTTTTFTPASKTSARLLDADDSTWIYLQPKAGVEGTIAEALTFRAWDRNSVDPLKPWANGATADTSPATTGRNLFSLYDPGTKTTRWFEYVASDKINWDNARSQAALKTLGTSQGFLATFASQAEVDAVKGKFSGNAWIGASDVDTEGEWKWMTGPEANKIFWNGDIKGKSVNNAFTNWGANEPNNWANNEDYAQLVGSTGAWNDNSGNANGYLVEYPPITGEPALLPFSTAFDTVSLTIQANRSPSLVAATSLQLQPMPALGARPQAGQLANSTSVLDLIQKATIKDGDASDPLGIAITGVQAGLELHYSLDGGSTWTKAGPLSESSALLLRGDDKTRLQLFDPTQTNADQTLPAALSFKAWDGSDGNSSGKSGINTTTIPTTAELTAATGNNRKIITFTDPNTKNIRYFEYIDFGASADKTWSKALADASSRSLGPLQGHLATFTSQAEVDAVKGFAQNDQTKAWIGASDAASEGDWTWVTGLEVGTSFWQGAAAGKKVNDAYVNWNNNEPNNSNNIEHYGQIVGGNGKWNDNTGSANDRSQGYLVEYSPEYNATRSPFSSPKVDASLQLQKINQAPVSMSPGGKAIIDLGSNSYGYSVVTQADGKILIAGRTYSQDAGRTSFSANYGVVRLNADGSLDTSFGDLVNGSRTGRSLLDLGTNSNDEAYSVVTQADGKILIAGNTEAMGANNGVGNNYGVVRLDNKGNLDTTFGTGGKTIIDLGSSWDNAYSMVTQGDGKILIAGTTNAIGANIGGGNNYGVVRLDDKGNLDATFGTSGKSIIDLGSLSDDSARSVITQSGGKILIAGVTKANSASNVGGSNFGLVRLNDKGGLDAAFGIGGKTAIDIGSGSKDAAYSIVTQFDGKILIAGTTNAMAANNGGGNNYGVVRLDDTGNLDTTFGTGGKTIIDLGSSSLDSASSIVTQFDRKILIAGTTDAKAANNGGGNNYGVVRLDDKGNLDTTFGAGGKTIIDLGSSSSDNAYSVVTQADGKILIAGTSNVQPAGSTSSFNNSNFAVVRLNADGSLDTTFAATTSLDGKATYLLGRPAVALDPDVRFSDPDLAAQGNYNGSRLTLQRDGTSNGGDRFTGLNSLTLEAGSAGVPGLLLLGASTPTTTPVAIGTWSQSGGKLEILFNSNANQEAVNKAASSIGYSFTPSAANPVPTEPIKIRWTFADGNSASQGLGGELSTTGTTQVTVAPPPADQTSSYKLANVGTSYSRISSLASQLTPSNVGQLRITDNDPDDDGIPNGGITDDRPTVVEKIAFQYTPISTSISRYPLAYTLSGPGIADPISGVLTDRGFIEFDLASTPLVIADNSSETYSIGAWFTGGPIVDGERLARLDLMGPQFVRLSTKNSQFYPNTKGNQDLRLFSEVTATTLGFTAPDLVASGQSFTFEVQAVDANGNVDRDATGEVTLQLASGTGRLVQTGSTAPPTANLTNGRATFSGLSYRASTDGELFKLKATVSGNAAGLGSSTSSAITADVVATKLLIDGTPSTTTLESGQANSLSGLRVAGVDADGAVDRQWLSGPGIKFLDLGPNSRDISTSLVTLPDGKILIAGGTNARPSGSTGPEPPMLIDGNFGVVRVNPDGNLDTKFGDGGKAVIDLGSFADAAYSLVTQRDGKVLVAGYTGVHPTGDEDNYPNYGVVRLDVDGKLDTSFGLAGKAVIDLSPNGVDQSFSVATQSNGKILLAGMASLQPGFSFEKSQYGVVRLNSDGKLDTGFGDGGKTLIDFGSQGKDVAYSLLTLADGQADGQADGKILVAGYTYAPPADGSGKGGANFGIVRLNADGKLDASFGTGGKAIFDFGSSPDGGVDSMAKQSDGKIIICGKSGVEYMVLRINDNGSLDKNFGVNGAIRGTFASFDNNPNPMAIQADGKILLAGISTEQFLGDYIGVSVRRFNADGSPDTSFATAGQALLTKAIPFTSRPISLTTQADGTIVIAVQDTDREADYIAIRLNADGSPDPSFGAPSLVLSLSGAVTPQSPDGSPLPGVVGGLSRSSDDGDTSPSTITLSRIALGNDGRIDLGALQLTYTNAQGSASNQLAIKAERSGGASLPAAFSPPLTSLANLGPNTPPTLALGSSSPAFLEAGGSYNTTGGSGPVAIAANATLSDAEQTSLQSLTVLLRNPELGDQLALATTPSGLTATVSPKGSELTITGTAPLSSWQTALQAITFTNSSDSPNTSTRQFTITANDGQLKNGSTSVDLNLGVTASNDLPSLTGLSALSLTTAEDQPLAMNLAGLAFADADAVSGSTPISLSLGLSAPGSLPTGSLSAKDGAGVRVSTTAGMGLQLQGSAEKLQAWLVSSANGLTYTPATNANGNVSLRVTADDGSGVINLGDTTISVAALNDEAVIEGLPAQSQLLKLRHGQPISFQSLLGNPLTLSDGDVQQHGNQGSSGRTQLSLTASHATFSGLSAGTHSGGATLVITNPSSWLLSGTPAQINALLADPSFAFQSTAAGPQTLTLAVDDGSGLSGASSSSTLNLLALSDPLLNNNAASSGSAKAIATKQESSLSFLSITDPDALLTSASSFLAESTYTLSFGDPGSSAQLLGLDDADTDQPGVQLKGTAAQINAALAAGRYQALTDGAASLSLSLSSALAPTINSTAYFNASNTAPTLTTVADLTGATEDLPYFIGFDALHKASNAADLGGAINGFEVTAVNLGVLLIAGSPWDATNNNRITANRPAQWTPPSDLNGNPVAAAFTVKAVDNGSNGGLTSATAIPVAIVVAPVNDLPTITGVPGSSSAVTTGVAANLAALTLADVDSSSITVSLVPSNGTIGGLTDSDPREGIQLSGTLAQLTNVLAAATFTATTPGEASIAFTVNDGDAASTKATYTFTASSPNSAPSLASLSAARSITTGLADALSYIVVSDPDGDQTLSLSLTISGSAGGSISGLSDADANAGIQISGSADSLNAALRAASYRTTSTGNVTISASLSDGIAQPVLATYSLTVSNPAPTLSTINTLSSGEEDQPLSITLKDLMDAADEADSNGSVKAFQVTAVDGNKGSLSIGGNPWDVTNNNRIDLGRPAVWTPYTNLNGNPVAAAFAVKAIDDGGAASSHVDVAITVAAVNDAPVLTSGTYTYTSVNEDTATAGATVTDLLAGRASDGDTGTSLGIAISGVSGLGSWQYSADGTTWSAISNVAGSAALLLSASTLVRYQPDGQQGEVAPTLTFSAWDGSDGTAGSKLDLSGSGGSRAFSSATNTATVTVTAVDDPLTLTLSRPTTTSNSVTAAAVIYQELDLDGVAGNDLVLLDSGLTLNDPDTAQTRSGVKLLINSGLVAAEDRLELQGGGNASTSNAITTTTRSFTVANSTATVTAAYNQTTGVLDLSTGAAQNQGFWQEVLRHVGYRNTSDNPTTTLNNQARVLQVEMLADSMFVRRDSNGLPHFYEYVSSDGISWSAAEAAARSRSYGGITGYLATITTQAENDFIAQRLTSNGWIGGSDAAVEGEWRWVTGPEIGTQFSSAGSAFGTAFRNWGSGEPNNSGSGEDYAQMRADTGKWNDLPNQPNLNDTNRPRGYLVEYSDASVTDITFSKTFNLAIQAGNDAPVLAPASPALTAITEDATSGPGQLVSTVVVVNANSITDVDAGAFLGGIAVTSLSSGNGSWHYNLGNNTPWQPMGSLSDRASLLLRPSDGLRFVPDGFNATSASFSYRAWDQSSGSAGDRVNTAQLGGSTAFSTRENTASISVTAVNDAPVWKDTTAIDLGTVAGNDPSNAGVKVSALVADGSDPDSGAATLGVAVVGLNEIANSTDIGNWEVSTDNGNNWTPLSLINPSISATTARLLAPTDRLRFTPSGAVAGTVSLDLRLWDRSPNSGNAGSSVNPGNGGGTSAYSTGSRSITATSSGITLAGTASSLSLTEGQTLAPGSSLTLIGNIPSSARVLIASGLTDGDQLEYIPISGNPITASYDTSKGELLLSGGSTSDQYQAALRAVTLKVGDDPTQFSSKRQIAYLLPGQTSSTAYTTVTVTATADAPSLSAASAVSFQEGGSAVALHPSLTLNDADDLQIASASVTISNSQSSPRLATDLLRFAGASGSPITATAYDSGTGVLSLSGTASLAEYQAALRSISFENTSTNPTNFGAATSRTITFAVTDANSDAAGAASGSSPVTLNVSAINSAPALSAGLERSYTEGGAAVNLDAGSTITITDADDTQLSGAVLEIITGYTSGDQLALPSVTATSTGISGSWDSGSHKLTLSGTTTLANYETALRAVTFSSSSDDPTAGNNTSRRIAIQVSDANRDGGGVSSGRSTSNQAGVDITVNATADVPVLTPGNSNASYTEAGAAALVVPNLTLSDADDTQLSKAVVSISNGLVSGDQLSFTGANGITGRYDSSSGTLTLKGPAALADYQSVLRSVRYSTNAADLASGSRTISWTVLDANSDGLTPQWSSAATSTLTVVGVNQLPLLSGFPSGTTSPTYQENGSPLVLAPELTLADPDSRQFSGATVTISSIDLTLGDSLALAQSVSGINATYTSNGVLTLTGVASLGAYQEALRQVVYSSSSDNPTAISSSRTLTWQITDSTTAASQVATSTIQLTPVNDLPSLSGFGGAVKTGAEDSTIEISYSDLIGSAAPQAQVADVDGTATSLQVAKLISGSLKLGPNASDATPYAAGTNSTIDATTKAYWTPAANANTSTNTNTNTNVNSNGLSAFSVVARDNLGALSPSPRPVSVMVTPDASDAAQISKVILPANGVFIPGDPLEVTIVYDQAVTVSGTPVLPITLNTGGTIQAAYVSSNGSSVLFRATVVAGQADGDGISVGSAIVLPPGATITSLDDGSPVNAALTLPALPSTAAVRVDGLNDAPSLGTNEAAIGYGENDPAKAVNPALSLSDADSSQLSAASVSITGGYTAGDLLSLPAAYLATGGSNGISASLTTTASGPVLTLSGRASLGTYQDVLRSITYRSTSDHPTASSTSRTISWQLSDYDATASLQASSAPFSTTINLSPRNDRPRFSALNPGAFSTSEDHSTEISLASLLAAADEADVDGNVTAFAVQQLASGSLRLGASEANATAWVAGSNASITSGVNAYWTPAANVNTTANTTLEAFSLQAVDDAGDPSATPVALRLAVTPDQADTARLSRFSLPANGTYAIGESLRFELVFDRAVTITGTSSDRPSLALQLAGGRSVVALLDGSQSGTISAGTPLIFGYTVQSGDTTVLGGSSGGIGLPASLTLPSATSLSSVDDGTSLAVPSALPAVDGSGLAVDGVSPLLATISGAAGNQASAFSQSLRLRFSEPVQGLDLSQLTLTASGSASGQLDSLQAVGASNGSAQEFDVLVTGISGSGILRLQLKGSISGLRDQAGNPLAGSSSGGELTVDRVAPPAPQINAIATEDWLSNAEASDSAGLTITGRTEAVEAGQLLGLAISPGTTASTALLNLTAPVASDGRWSLTLTPSQLAALADGAYTATTSVSDAAGNAAPATSRSFRLDRLAPSLSNPRLVGGASAALADGALNSAETSSALSLNGSSDAEDGQSLELILGGASGELSRRTTVQGGTWELALLPQELEALGDGELVLQLYLSDLAGNTTSLSESINLDRSAPGLNLLPVAGDGWINRAESGQALLLQGLSEGLEDGQNVSLTLAARVQNPTVPYTSSISNDAFSLSIPADELLWADGSTIEISVNSSDRSGNPVQLSRSVRVDLTPPTMALQLLGLAGGPVDLAGFSGVINAGQIAAGLQIGSAASADAAVTVVDAGSRTGLLVAPQAQADGSQHWAMAIEADRMGLPLEGTVPISVRSLDGAGNSISASASLKVDRAAALSLTAPIDGAGGNNRLNASEAGSVLLTGQTDWVEPGTVINLNVRGTAAATPLVSTTTTTGSDGRWSINADWSTLADGQYNLELELSDRAGNRAEVRQPFAINTAPPVYVVTALAGDSILNASELGRGWLRASRAW